MTWLRYVDLALISLSFLSSTDPRAGELVRSLVTPTDFDGRILFTLRRHIGGGL